MIILKIIIWLIIGFIVELISVCLSGLCLSNTPPYKIYKDGRYVNSDKEDFRLVFSIVLWPVALAIRILKFIVAILVALCLGLKEEIKLIMHDIGNI